MPKDTKERIIDRQKGTAGRAGQYTAGSTATSPGVDGHTHDGNAGSGGTWPIGNHSDVSAAIPAADDVLVWDGSAWVNNAGIPQLTGTPTAGRVASWSDDRTLQDSGVAVGDLVSFPLGNTQLTIDDTDASHTLTLKPGSDLSANRTLTLTTGDADRTVTLSGNLTVPETGTAALLGVANVFTAVQTLTPNVAGGMMKLDRTANAAIDDVFAIGVSADATNTDFIMVGVHPLNASTALLVRDTGHVAVATTDDNAQFNVLADSASTVGAYINTAATPSADIQQWAINGTVTSVIDNNARLGIGTTSLSTYAGITSVIEAKNSGHAAIAANAATDSIASFALVENDTIKWHLLSRGNQGDRLEVWSGNNSAARVTVEQGGNTGLGTTSPQGLLHGNSDVGRFLFWDFNDLAGTTQTVIPNGAGDVTGALGVRALIVASDGTTRHTVGSGPGLTPGDETSLDGVDDNIRIRVNADGSVDVRRVSGTLTYDVALWLVWI